ncbi:unnamed protein product [Cuscuta campestris]|uniref:Uncharacterized protein n=1 Tax=Cuscuta campestris TaxID=132261 RepID=A0A484LCI0_9ASTE|nr:unnamed protein product [Cuscuta campestris]
MKSEASTLELQKPKPINIAKKIQANKGGLNLTKPNKEVCLGQSYGKMLGCGYANKVRRRGQTRAHGDRNIERHH